MKEYSASEKNYLGLIVIILRSLWELLILPSVSLPQTNDVQTFNLNLTNR